MQNHYNHDDRQHHDDHHHAHAHAHDHSDGTSHAHTHDHSHGTSHEHDHDVNGHENMLHSKEEAAAFLTYTLHHNAHHEEELSGLVHSLAHLQLENQAQEIRLCIADIDRANKRLEGVLASLK